MLRLLRFRERTPGPALDGLPYVVLDTEFTSFDHRINRLLSVGAIAMHGAAIRLGEQFYRVVNPGVAVPAPGILVHGLREGDIAQGAAPAEVVADLQRFLASTAAAGALAPVLVGHFVDLDLKILRKEYSAAGLTLNHRVIDTARVHRWLLRHGPYTDDLGVRLRDLRLSSVARSYGLDSHAPHHALDDAFLTARLWQRQIHMLAEHDVRGLEELGSIAG
jgi:DNA polymerase-3 subunit epsilon